MSKPKRAPIPRVLAALLGALAILALVAGPSLAHPARLSPSRVYEPAVSWSTQATLFGAAPADSAVADEADADELEAEDTSGDDQGADENEQGDSGGQQVQHHSGGDHQGSDEGGGSNDGGGDSGGDGGGDGGGGGDGEGGD